MGTAALSSPAFDRTSPLRWFLSHVRRFWLEMTLFLLGGLIWEVCSAAVPVITGRAFDAVLGGRRDAVALGSAAALLVAVLLVRGVVAGIGGKFVQETMGTGFVRDLRDELYLDLLRKGQSFFDRRPVGDIMARATNDVHELNLMLNPGINMVIGSAMFIGISVSPMLSAAKSGNAGVAPLPW